MRVQPLVAGTVLSIVVLTAVSFKTITDSKSRNPERLPVALAAAAKPIPKACRECGVVIAIREHKKRYEIRVRMSDGNLRTLFSGTQPIWKAGDKVRLQNGKLAG